MNFGCAGCVLRLWGWGWARVLGYKCGCLVLELASPVVPFGTTDEFQHPLLLNSVLVEPASCLRDSLD